MGIFDFPIIPAPTIYCQLAKGESGSGLLAADRSDLERAADVIEEHGKKAVSIGIILGTGLALGLVALKWNRQAIFAGLRVHESPSHVVFRDGRVKAIPKLPPLRATGLFEYPMLILAPAGGLTLGVLVGMQNGSSSAYKILSKDPESKKRIEKAFLQLKADQLRNDTDAWRRNYESEDESRGWDNKGWNELS